MERLINMTLAYRDILALARNGSVLDGDQALTLLSINNGSSEFYELLAAANELSREVFGNRGFVFGQAGINAEPCSKNCKFCSLGKEHYSVSSIWRKSIDEVVMEARSFIEAGVSDLFLMTTADYPVDEFLEVGRAVRQVTPDDIKLVANIGDFGSDIATELKKTGFTGAYHIHRLREGIDTGIEPEVRINTLDAIKNAGLELYYCIEPIGPEHTYEEIVAEMLRAQEYDVGVMAVMRRIPVPGTPLSSKGQISALELTKIAAVTRLVVQPYRAMNAHEPVQMSLLAGVNQLYAETGANPRDAEANTERNRGMSVATAKQMLVDAEYIP
jgi:biotin synthase